MWKCTLLWTKMILKSPPTLNRQFTWISNLFHLLLAANKRIRQQFFSTSQKSWLSSGVLLMQSFCRSCFPLLDQTCIPSVWSLEPKLNVLVKPLAGTMKRHGTMGDHLWSQQAISATVTLLYSHWISWMGSQKDHETQVLAKNHSICLWVLTLRNSEPCWDDTFAWSSQPDWSNKGMFPANNFQALPLLANSNRGCSSSSHLWSSWTPLSHSPNHKQTHHLYHCTRGTEAAPCQHRISWKVRSEN